VGPLAGGPAGGLPFAAGQFCWLAFGRAAPWNDNPFSMASAPGETAPRFVIREAGDRTSTLGALRPGLPVRVDGPHGAFTLQGRPGNAPLLLVAGGAGIAPILSLLRDLHARRAARIVRLLHGARRADRLVEREEVAAIAAAHPGWHALWRSEEDGEAPGVSMGLLDRAAIAEAIEGIAPTEMLVMICGPEPMTLAVATLLEEMGVPPGQIVFELFDYA
jgi:ferredoxin-NADP reductase